MLNVHSSKFDSFIADQQVLHDKNQKTFYRKGLNQGPRLSIPHQGLFQNNQNQVITVPIKQYSNKFLREKKKEDSDACSKKKEPFPNSHLYHNRKLISDFKKYKGKSQKFKNSVNKENADFIIYNLLFDKQETSATFDGHRKTIFGTFTQNFAQNPTKNINRDSVLFENGWRTSKNINTFEAKKQVYDKICKKQKSLVPQYRKKCKTIGQCQNSGVLEQEKKMQKISTSRALEKYSKIIKINPQHGKIEKMKIKKQLARSIRLESSERNEIQTKQIRLTKKQILVKNKNLNGLLKRSDSKKLQSFDSQNSEQLATIQQPKTPQKSAMAKAQQRFLSSQVSMFTPGINFKRGRKFSNQMESKKKCITEEKIREQKQRTFEEDFDFEINGWDINF